MNTRHSTRYTKVLDVKESLSDPSYGYVPKYSAAPRPHITAQQAHQRSAEWAVIAYSKTAWIVLPSDLS